MAAHLRTELVLEALGFAVQQRLSRVRVPRPSSIHLPGRVADGRLRLHRGLVLPTPSPFRPGLPVTHFNHERDHHTAAAA